MRLMEVCTLRLRDLDFDRAQIIRQGKDDKDRLAMLLTSLEPALRGWVTRAERLHEDDLSKEGGYVPVPEAIAH